MIILECDIHPVWPGSFQSLLGGRQFRRWWFLWFAVAYWPGDLKEYGEACRGAEWRYPIRGGRKSEGEKLSGVR